MAIASGMRSVRALVVLLVLSACSLATVRAEDAQGATASPAVADAGTAAFFTQRIAPILEKNCLRCHGNARQKGHLKLNSREAMLQGGGRGPAIVVGDPEHSILVTSVRYADEDLQMPPDNRLSEAQIADLVAWIAKGATWGQDPPAPAAKDPVSPSVAGVATDPANPTHATDPVAPDTTKPIASSALSPSSVKPPASPGTKPTAMPGALTEEKSWQAGRPLFGKLHLLVIHFPVAALALALLAELLAWWRGPAWEPAVRLLVFCGTAGAVMAVATGTFFADDGSMFRRGDNRALMLHEVAGWLTLVISVAASGLLLGGSSRWIFRAVLLGSAALAGLTAHLGGEMAYGANWLF